MKNVLIVLSLLLPLSPLFATVKTPFHLTVKEGLPNNTVYHAMQDRQGFLWFCTETGVCRFDGQSFEYFTVADGLGDNEIFKSYEDSRGRIWFLSFNGKLSFYQSGRLYHSGNTPWLGNADAAATLLDCLEDSNGSLWISPAGNKIIRIHDTSAEIRSQPDNYYTDYNLNYTLFRTGDSVTHFRFDPDGNMYLLNHQTGKLRLTGTYRTMPRLTLEQVSFRELSNAVISQKGIVLMHGDKAAVLPMEEYGQHEKAYCLLSRDSTLFIGTDNGLCIVRKEQAVRRVLEGNTVTSVLSDKEGNLWATTLGNGVFLFRHADRFTENISGVRSLSVAVLEQEGLILAGHGNSTFTVLRNGVPRTVRVSADYYNRVLDIIPLRASQKILICSDDDVSVYDPKVGTLQRSGISNYKSHAFLGNKLWIVTPRTIVAWDRRKRLSVPVPDVRYTSVLPLTDSVYYLGTTTSLYRVAGQKVTVLLTDPVLKAGIKDLRLIDGRLWVATHGNGIWILKDDKPWKRLQEAAGGLTSNFCERLYDDGQRLVWTITNKGLSVLDRHSGNVLYRVPVVPGSLSNDVKSVAVTDSFVFIATAEGVNRFRKEALLRQGAPPAVYVTGFNRGDQKIIDPGAEVAFPYFNGSVSISFAVPTYQAPKDVLFAYRAAEDSTWHYTREGRLQLLDLPPGRHRILIKGRKYNSGWSQPLSFTMEVSPRFFQSVWFRLSLAAVLLLAGYLFFARRLRSLRKREEQKRAAEQKIAELESRTLSCQMNPHFIFNSLNTIQQFILVNDEEQGLAYLGQFSTLMRQILENSRKPSVALSEEVAFLERYLRLEQIRYDNRFDYRIEIQEGLPLDQIQIPPVMLQPLLENAIKHGVSAVTDGRVRLKVSMADNYLLGVVEDNGKGFRANTANKQGMSTALRVLEERLRLIQNARGLIGSMQIINRNSVAAETGTRVEIYIPVL